MHNISIITCLLLVVAAAFVLVLVKYITTKKRIDTYEKRIKELAQKNIAKDKFFSIISHDLRSPFGSLLGFSEMLVYYSDDIDKNEVKSYSKQIYLASGKLLSLVENLLLWSRNQLGTTVVRPEKIDIKISSENVINAMKLSIQEKDIALDFEIERGLTAFADSNLYSSIFRNLLSNAIKYCNIGGNININANQNNNNEIEITIRDNGVGMSSEQLELLFRIDNKYSTAGTMNESGSGLGLILSKEFVELNGGKMKIKSEKGKGTTVKFTVPIN